MSSLACILNNLMSKFEYGEKESDMSAGLQHHLNPLHIYCRLRDLGLKKRSAMVVCMLYERSIFRFLKANEGI